MAAREIIHHSELRDVSLRSFDGLDIWYGLLLNDLQRAQGSGGSVLD